YFQEDDARIFAELLAETAHLKIAAPTILETTIAAVSRRGPDAAGHIRSFVRDAEIKVMPFGEVEYEIAIDAFLRYGKGRGNRAQLNFGDCMSYAVSKIEGLPLLFKGDDFRLTDVDCAI
ncbi:MAG: type II toxin-antitoxin system VapC family toxin, partial [Alphaproteobacteria bacterium]|nr:type II toxin-antitoxin system VapC family toxin [Alphaproteobacteria bacterium]